MNGDDDAQSVSSLGYTSGGAPIAGQQLGFVYDAGWNMTNRSVSGVGTAYPVNDLNQVLGDSTYNLAFDANGNLTQRLVEPGNVYYLYSYNRGPGSQSSPPSVIVITR